ncbi:hypothetical protein K4L06_21085 [Lysobacter sp. BMK333-48F3]|uniref:hypothetical protein n=1 Tax=Lysobacter sp. BMK333-48F3 TaxID=2867962 RepID=UPI001C8CC5C0|nr:hypothetical protein [Lysobacter sp. BMK333-48F3]MBX9403808.1 hypothetical protein [Lysobacter sp. BMK333-48F3]
MTYRNALRALGLSGLLLVLPVAAQADPAEGEIMSQTSCEDRGWAYEVVTVKYRWSGGQWVYLSQSSYYSESCPPIE